MNVVFQKINDNFYPWATTVQNISEEIIPRFVRLHGLTLVEMQVLQLVVSGTSMSKLSKLCFRSIKTLSSHKRTAFKKIGVNTDIELVHYIYWSHEKISTISDSRK